MTSEKTKLKPTTNLRQAWLLGVMVVCVSLAFGLLVLPKIGGRRVTLEGTVAPDFALDVFSGGSPGSRMRLSTLQGKVVVLDFWASWCGPCREQAPIIEALAQKSAGKDVIVAGVNTSDDRDDALTFVKAHGLSYAMLYDAGSRVGTAYGVKQLPTMVVVGKSGRVVAVRPRIVRAEELDALVADAAER